MPVRSWKAWKAKLKIELKGYLVVLNVLQWSYAQADYAKASDSLQPLHGGTQ